MTQLWNSGHKDAGSQVGGHRVWGVFVENRTRAMRRRLFRELQAVVGATLQREKETAGRDGPTVERQVVDHDIAGHGDEP